jgi:hypothetical protein
MCVVKFAEGEKVPFTMHAKGNNTNKRFSPSANAGRT